MRFIMAIGMMVFAFACHTHDGVGFEGDVVGGPCAGNVDCQYRCESGADFPRGTCVKPCSTDDDCPPSTFCVDRDGGICLLGCDLPADCRDGYSCKGERNRGHGGDSLVCIK